MATENGYPITRQHPVYNKMLPDWEFYRDSYMGGSYFKKPARHLRFEYNNDYYALEVAGSYLYPTDLEANYPRLFYQRHMRSVPTRWCKIIVNTYSKYIFSNKSKIARDYETTDGKNGFRNYEPYICNIDLLGTHIDNFMLNLAENMMLFGRCFIVVDRQPLPDGINSLQDQIDIGNRAYVRYLTPFMVQDWSWDKTTGQYNWVFIKLDVMKDTDPFENRESHREYLLITRENYITFDSEGEEKDRRPHNLGFVPIIPCQYNDIDLNNEPESMIDNIAQINREIYNAHSLYQEELYKLARSQLMIQKAKEDFTDVLDDKEGDNGVDDVVLSANAALPYAEGVNKPEYLRFPVDALVEKREYIDSLELRLLQMAGLERVEGVSGANYTSGIALALSYNDTYYTVAQMAQKISGIEKRLWDMINRFDYNGQTNSLVDGQIEVKYPDHYDVLAATEKRENYKIIKDYLNNSPTANKIADMQYVELTLRPTQDEKQKIEDELDELYQTESALNESINEVIDEDIKPNQVVTEEGDDIDQVTNQEDNNGSTNTRL